MTFALSQTSLFELLRGEPGFAHEDLSELEAFVALAVADDCRTHNLSWRSTVTEAL